MAGWNGLSEPVASLQQVQAADLEARRKAEEICREKALTN
jgi:1-deoxy-D-xylulose-5-phosphate reductoisomerase